MDLSEFADIKTTNNRSIWDVLLFFYLFIFKCRSIKDTYKCKSNEQSNHESCSKHQCWVFNWYYKLGMCVKCCRPDGKKRLMLMNMADVLLFTSAQLQQDLTVIARRVALYKGVQGFSVHLQELCFDIQHIYLCTSHHNPDQHTICSP